MSGQIVQPNAQLDRNGASEAAGYRKFLFPKDHPRLAGLSELDPIEYADHVRDDPVLGPMLAQWAQLFEQTRFRGITTDGQVVHGLFDGSVPESAPNASTARATAELLARLSPDQRARVGHPLDSKVWRAWMNPEAYVNRFGLRLEDLEDELRELILDVVRQSTSPRGFAKVVGVMRTNAFLGTLVGLPRILNAGSYNFNLFGTPGHQQPWGWSLYGHHLCLSCLFVGDQQVFTPVFFGAEPNEIDSGPHAGTTLFTEMETAALTLVRALPNEVARKAILVDDKRAPSIPHERFHYGDELHLGGAFRDNRVIPYEGASAAEFDAESRGRLLDLIEMFLDYQPDGPRAARLRAVEEHLANTWFCWMGGTGAQDTFYFRIQSPVILLEFDHHAGIFLANTQPERFHIHTLVRTPNGNDYGHALVCRCTGRHNDLTGPV